MSVPEYYSRAGETAEEEYNRKARSHNTRQLDAAVAEMSGYSRRRSYGRSSRYSGEDYGVGRRGSQVYAGHGYGGSSRTRYSHAYGGSRRKWTPGYDRTVGFYGRFTGQYHPGVVSTGGEMKFHDIDVDDAVVDAAGTIQNAGTINIIPQGDTEKTRNGRKCTITVVQWRYEITLPEVDAAATPSEPDQVRVMLYVDHQCNGATAAVLDILETTNYQSFRNLAQGNRFTILMDKTHTLNYAGMASDEAAKVSQASVHRNYSFYKKCKIPLEFSGNTGAIGEIRSNNIGVCLISHGGGAGFASKIRLRFSDASAMLC